MPSSAWIQHQYALNCTIKKVKSYSTSFLWAAEGILLQLSSKMFKFLNLEYLQKNLSLNGGQTKAVSDAYIFFTVKIMIEMDTGYKNRETIFT